MLLGLICRLLVMELLHNLMSESLLEVHGVDRSRLHLLPELGDLLFRYVRHEVEVVQDEMVGDGHDLAVHTLELSCDSVGVERALSDSYVVIQALAHLLPAIGADKERDKEHLLRMLPHALLHFPAQQAVESLVCASELDIGFDSHRIVALQKRIEHLRQRYGVAGTVSSAEILSGQELGNCEPARKAYYLIEGEPGKPLGLPS